MEQFSLCISIFALVQVFEGRLVVHFDLAERWWGHWRQRHAATRVFVERGPQARWAFELLAGRTVDLINHASAPVNMSQVAVSMVFADCRRRRTRRHRRNVNASSTILNVLIKRLCVFEHSVRRLYVFHVPFANVVVKTSRIWNMLSIRVTELTSHSNSDILRTLCSQTDDISVTWRHPTNGLRRANHSRNSLPALNLNIPLLSKTPLLYARRA